MKEKMKITNDMAEMKMVVKTIKNEIKKVGCCLVVAWLLQGGEEGKEKKVGCWEWAAESNPEINKEWADLKVTRK